MFLFSVRLLLCNKSKNLDSEDLNPAMFSMCGVPAKLLQSCPAPWTVGHQTPLSKGLSSKNNGVGCRALLQTIFPTQGSNPHLFTFPALAAGSLPLAPSGLLLNRLT